MPSTSAPIASADSTEPPRSKRPACASRVFGTFGIASTSAPIARTIGVAKTHGHVKLSTTIDETNRPMMPPAPANPAHSAIARGFSSVGKLEVITESVTGMIIAAADTGDDA